MLNKAQIIGHLGADPEIRKTQDGRSIANFNVATSERWSDKDTGEKKERTEWHRVVIFNEHIAKVAEQYLKKGSKVYVEGQMATRKWEDQNGVERYTTEIVIKAYGGGLTMLDGAAGTGGVPKSNSEDDYGQTKTVDRSAGDYGNATGRDQPKQDRQDSYGNQSANFDDDIPFMMEWR